ncbi:hypothetical protein GCM10022217_25280 [Chryseobacterium ginsenosidimutans]|uniref:hypothetical protein n=1 Tax=Chryseobacterium ginsenosidimutans TaxID=687846 RepID=UPI0031E421DE
MGVSKYGFPERLFFDNKDDDKTSYFLEEIDIDLSVESKFDYPSLGQVKAAISETSFQFDNGQIIEEFGNKKWACRLYENGEVKTPIYINHVIFDNDKVKDISFQRGDDKAIIEFLWHLSKYCGSILFYCDTGSMILIRTDKTIEETQKNFYEEN